MKKTKFILGVVAATAMVAMTMTGCDGLTLNNESERSGISGYAVKSITLDTTEVAKEFVINTDFSYTGLKVTATYVDDSTADVSNDVIVTAPDTKTTGKKTVTVSYGKTSLGKDCTAVKATYDIEVTLKVTSIALKDGVTIYTYNSGNKALYASDAKFTATYSDNSTKDILLSEASFADVSNGKVTFTYADVTLSEITVTNSTSTKDLLDAGVSTKDLLDAGANIEDFLYKSDGSATGVPLCGYTGTYTSTTWWTEISSGDKEVAVDGMIQTVFKNNSYGTDNWSGPVYRIADSTSTTEFAVVRNDNYGWGSGYSSGDPAVLLDGVTLERKDIAWDGFPALITGSTEYVTVKNDGATIDVYLYFVKDGEVVYYQTYKGIHGDGNAIQFKVMADNGANITYCE